MLSVVLVLGLAVLGVRASDEDCCSFGDQQIVKAQWNAFWNTPDSSSAKIIFGKAVFEKFFEEDPDSKSLFTHLNVDDLGSAEFSGHILRVLTGFDLITNLLGEYPLESELYHVNEQHQMREGVRVHHFDVMFRVLDESLSQVLEDYDRLAWKFCFRHVKAVLSHDLSA